MKAILLTLFLTACLYPQNASAPLEVLHIENTSVSSEIVQQMAGLKIGQPINKEALNDAVRRLADTALFSNVQYRYTPTPKHGYAVTLDLQDETDLIAAAVDIPLVDEAQVWPWLSSRYPTLRHKIPKADAAQDFLAKEIGAHWAAELDGQRLVARQESEVATNKPVLVFQPENLPQMASLEFTGVQELTSDQLAAIIHNSMKSQGFSERTLREYLEGGGRNVYQEHGMYRVQFPKITATRAGKLSVNVKCEVVEGPQFSLATVRVSGADASQADAMLKAATFKTGVLANWLDIQQSIVKTQKPLLRLGYQEATVVPLRHLNDAAKQLDLELATRPGPLYHFGQVTFAGLAPDLDAKAHALWKMQAGDVFDSFYAYDFARDFLNSTGLRDIQCTAKTESIPGHIANQVVTFSRKTK